MTLSAHILTRLREHWGPNKYATTANADEMSRGFKARGCDERGFDDALASYRENPQLFCPRGFAVMKDHIRGGKVSLTGISRAGVYIRSPHDSAEFVELTSIGCNSVRVYKKHNILDVGGHFVRAAEVLLRSAGTPREVELANKYLTNAIAEMKMLQIRTVSWAELSAKAEKRRTVGKVERGPEPWAKHINEVMGRVGGKT